MKAPDAIEAFRGAGSGRRRRSSPTARSCKAEVLEAPRLGCFNLHGSLLPRWRGAAPIQRAIMAGDRQTGVQIMRMTEGLDEGPILLSEVMRIRADDTAATLRDRMAARGRRPVAARPGRHRARRRSTTAAADGRAHLRQEDHPRRGAHRLDPPGRRGRRPHPRPVALPRRLVRAADRTAPGADQGADVARRGRIGRGRRGAGRPPAGRLRRAARCACCGSSARARAPQDAEEFAARLRRSPAGTVLA